MKKYLFIGGHSDGKYTTAPGTAFVCLPFYPEKRQFFTIDMPDPNEFMGNELYVLTRGYIHINQLRHQFEVYALNGMTEREIIDRLFHTPKSNEHLLPPT